MSRPRRDLIFSAGGGFGSWQAGALAGLHAREACEWARVAGTSVGAFNAAVLAQRPVAATGAAVAELSDLWRTLEHPGLRQLPSRARIMASVLCCGACSGSVLSRAWLDALADVVDWDAVLASDRLLLIGVTAFRTGQAEYHSNGACAECGGRRHSAAELRELLVASMAVPAMFPAVTFDDRELVDGGLADIVPRLYFDGTGGVDVVCSEPVEPPPRWRLASLNVHLRLYMATSAMASAVAETNLAWLARAYAASPPSGEEAARGRPLCAGVRVAAAAPAPRREAGAAAPAGRLRVVRPRRLRVVSGLVGLSRESCMRMHDQALREVAGDFPKRGRDAGGAGGGGSDWHDAAALDAFRRNSRASVAEFRQGAGSGPGPLPL